MKKKSNASHIVWVTEAALMLALLLVIQLFSFVLPKSVPIVSQLVTGSLVNLALIVGSGSVGFAAVAVAAILSPVLAFVLGQMPFPQMILVIALGNLGIVAITWVFFKNRNKLKQNIVMDISGIITGSIAKWLFLWGASVWIMVPMFFSQNQAVGAKIALMFSWPQLVTALIGGFLAILILPAIRDYRKKRV